MKYGGAFENRARLALETTDAVRCAWPAELPLWFRVSATDWAPGGWGGDDTVGLARLLGQHGVDLLDCSSGAVIADATIPFAPGFQVPFAERVKRETGMASGAVGDLTAGKVGGWEVIGANLSPTAVAALQPRTMRATRIAHGRYTFELREGERPEPFIAAMTELGGGLVSASPTRATLEDVFVEQVS